MSEGYRFLTDPGHGWLEVTVAELMRLQILGKISAYSYLSDDGKRAFLEEDCDAPVFIEAKKAAGEEITGFDEQHTNGDCIVRSMRSYPFVQSE